MPRIARFTVRVPSLCLMSVLLGLSLAVLPTAGGAATDQGGAPVAPPVWTVLASTPTSLRLEVEIPGYLRRPAGEPGRPGAVDLVIPGGAETGVVGAPALPTVSRLVAIPAGMRVTGVVVDHAASVLEGLDLAPLRAGEEAPFVRDADAYARAGWRLASFPAAATELAAAGKAAAAALPAPVAALGHPAILAGQPVVALTVAPVAYDAAAMRVVAASRVVVELRFAEGEGGIVPARERPLPASFAALAGGQVLGLPRGKSLPVMGTEPGLWVAVVRNNATVLSKLQPLLDWRRRQGYSVEIVDADAAGNTTAGIKAALKAIYDDSARPPLEYVVLVGDAGNSTSTAVATWRESLSGYNGEGDHYYAMLDGDDILADVHVGRLSFSSSALSQLDVIVNKIVGYESNPPMDDTAWYGRASLMGDPNSSGITTIWVNQWLKTKLEGLGWTHIDTTWSGNFATRMVSTLNPGASVFAYRGYLGMSGINTGHIGSLTNGARLPVALLPTCGTGSFWSDSEARCESWLRAANGGGIAAVGTATIGTHTRYNNAFFLNMWDGLLEGADHRIGVGHSVGKLGLYTNYYTGEPAQAEIWAVWNSLMGDPATGMWKGVPQPLSVTAPATLPLGANTFAVTVKSGFAPVPGLLVCALDAGGARLRGVTDAQGGVTLAGAPPVAGTLELTVSGPGFLPYLGTVTVGAQDTFCGLTALQVIDNGTLGSTGNGDGLAGPGETLALLPTLANTGTVGAIGVTSTLGGGGVLATVLSGAQAYGDIGPGLAAAAIAPALVAIAPDARDGDAAQLALVAGDGARTWASTVTLTVTAPRLSVAGVAFGGPGGTCDPGESGSLVVTLANGGVVAAGPLTAELATTSPWLLVTDGDGAYGGIAAGGSAANTGAAFAVFAASDCFTGHLAPFTLVLRAGGVAVATLEFVLPVGTLASNSPSGPDAFGYYAFDDTDVASGRAPVYDWVELAPYLGGSGASVGLSDFGWEQDDTKTVPLPFPFGFYGKEQSELSICSNGWAAFGPCALVSYHNAGLPGAGGTPRALLAPFWDNLGQSGNNLVYHWHDTANHRYIVQWHGLVQNYEGYDQDTQDFQLILLDPAHHQTTSGQGMIIFQYKTVNDTDDRNAYATVGIQSPDGRDGLLYGYMNQAMGGAAPLASGRAILFVPLGDLVTPVADVSPTAIAASAAPGAVVVREVDVVNTGDEGSVLRVDVSRLDPAILGGGKSAEARGDDLIVRPSSIAGSTFTMDAVDYEAGTTVDLHLVIDAVTQGQEWITDIAFDAPPGVQVNASTAWSGGNQPIISNNATGDGARVVWASGGYLDDGNTGAATVNVTFGAQLAGNVTFGWELQGDNYGDPPHFLSGEIVLASRGPSIRVAAPVAGTVAVIGQPLTVSFTALNGPTDVAVELQREEGGTWETLTPSTPAAAGSWTWPAVAGNPGPWARVRVLDVAEPATADTSAVFAIGRDLSWLTASPAELEVPAGESRTLELTLDATGLEPGLYEAIVVLAGTGMPVMLPVTFTVTTTSAVDGTSTPARVVLYGAVPNPFNPRTTIRFAVPVEQHARLDVHSVDGRLVRRLLDGRVAAGPHDVTWDGRDDAGREVASGVYVHRLTSGGQVQTGKMILAR
ncbi:MAG: hypothetical protein IPK64_02770 [bacterium]|nr:hypothetical protein [bacterium]